VGDLDQPKFLLNLIKNVKPDIEFSLEEAQQIINENQNKRLGSVKEVVVEWIVGHDFYPMTYHQRNNIFYIPERKTVVEIILAMSKEYFPDAEDTKQKETEIGEFFVKRVQEAGFASSISVVVGAYSPISTRLVAKRYDLEINQILTSLQIPFKYIDAHGFSISLPLAVFHQRCQELKNHRKKMEDCVVSYLQLSKCSFDINLNRLSLTFPLKYQTEKQPHADAITHDQCIKCFSRLDSLVDKKVTNIKLKMDTGKFHNGKITIEGTNIEALADLINQKMAAEQAMKLDPIARFQ